MNPKTKAVIVRCHACFESYLETDSFRPQRCERCRDVVEIRRPAVYVK